jgi:antirestriction protein ArdC
MHRKISAEAAHLLITDTSRLLPVLKNDPRAIFTAASLAQQAADWMHGRQPRPIDPESGPSVLSAEAEKGELVS